MWPGTLKGRSGRDLVWKLILRQENMGSTGDRVKNKKKKKTEILSHSNQNDNYQETSNNKYWGGCEGKGTLILCWGD